MKYIENYKTKIMETNRHQIIYSYTESRKELFEQLVDEYKIKANENHPMAIYLDKIGLPNIEYVLESCVEILAYNY